MGNSAYLAVRNLTISFTNSEHPTIRGISFAIAAGETLALVGKSGSGKTLIAESIMRLRPNVTISGEIFVDRQPILNLPYPDLVAIRRHKVAHIFQEPAWALNPVLTVGYQLLEIAEGLGRKDRALGMLRKVGFRDPLRIFRAYPHELSGGMQQRVMIALALMNRPKLLIADEPTTAFDVILQDQILALIKALQEDLGFAMLLVTHDFSILQRMADRVCVMSGGEIVERGVPDDIIFRPRHECTKLLSGSILMLPRESD